MRTLKHPERDLHLELISLLIEVRTRSGWYPDGRWLRITDISKEDRPVKNPEKVKKASSKTGRVADQGNILGCHHNWLLLVCFMIIHILIQAGSVVIEENTNESEYRCLSWGSPVIKTRSVHQLPR